VLHAARWKCRTQKIAKKSPSAHHHTTLSGYIFATKARRQSEKNLLSSNMSSICPHDMVNFSPLVAETCWRVWDTPANFNGFRVLTALLQGILVAKLCGVEPWAPARGGQGGRLPTLEKIRVSHAHPGNTNRGLKTFRQ